MDRIAVSAPLMLACYHSIQTPKRHPSIRPSSDLRSISRCADSRFGKMASISSMNTMHGARSDASWNRERSLASDSPAGAHARHQRREMETDTVPNI